MFNPRFPHTLRIKRTKMVSGQPVIDTAGNVTYEYVSLTIVDMADEEPVRDVSGAFITHTADSINFGYRTSSRSMRTAGDVVKGDYKIACPMFLTEILTDDILEITDYDRTYTGRVVKKTTFNLGTNIWFDEIRN